MPSAETVARQQDIERLENQVSQLTRIIANLNERLNHLESQSTHVAQ